MSIEGIPPIGSGTPSPPAGGTGSVGGAAVPPGGMDVGTVARSATSAQVASRAPVPDTRPPSVDRPWTPPVPWSSVDDLLEEISRLLARAGDLLAEVRGAPAGAQAAARAELAEVLDQVSVLVKSLTRLAVPPTGSAVPGAVAGQIPAVAVTPGVPVPLLDADGRPVAGVMVVSLEQIAVAVALTATDAEGPYVAGSDGARRLAAALGVDLAASGLGSVIGVVVDEADGQITGVRLLVATGPGAAPGGPASTVGLPGVPGTPAPGGTSTVVGGPVASGGTVGGSGTAIGGAAAGPSPTSTTVGPGGMFTVPGATPDEAALGVNLRSLPDLSQILGGAVVRGAGGIDVAAALVNALRAQGATGAAQALSGSLTPAGLALLDLLSAQEAAAVVSGQIVGQAGTSLLAQVGTADRQAFVLLLFGGMVAPTTTQPRPVEPKRKHEPPDPDPDNDRGRDETGESPADADTADDEFGDPPGDAAEAGSTAGSHSADGRYA